VSEICRLVLIFQAGAEKRGGSLWYDCKGTEIMNANVSKLNIPHPYFLYLNHENISEVFLQLASEDTNFKLLDRFSNGTT